MLLRKGEDAEQAEVLLPSSKYFTYPGPRGGELDIATADDLGKAARAAAEAELQREVDEVVLVYANNPATSPNLSAGSLVTLAEGRNELHARTKLGRLQNVEEFYVLVTLPRQIVSMKIEAPTPAPANRGI